jgi:high-affinity nickel-transport protein
MIAAASYVLLGFFLGVRHAADADHVVAVSTIVTRQRTLRAGIVTGAVWGLGHTVTILVVGGVLIVCRIVIPPALGLTMEMTVALMLVALGLWTLRDVRSSLHGMTGGGAPARRHRHGGDDLDRRLGRVTGAWLLRPLVVGLVHGLAGSAAVALLVLGTIDDARWAMVYLALFGVGTVVGMVLITAAIAAPLAYASRRSMRLDRQLRLASGLLSLALGLVLVYQIGFGEELFTGPRPGPPG